MNNIQINPEITRYSKNQWVILIVLTAVQGCTDKSQAVSVDNFSAQENHRWQIQLLGPVNTVYNAETYIIDLFDSSESLILELKNRGVQVICYFSAGSSEDWREDADHYTDADKGEALQGWEGENWLDIRSPTVRTVTIKRLNLAVKKGCDGVDPDNVNGYVNQTGFDLTREDQLDFNKYIATAAHQRGLLVGLKNAVELIPELYEEFDFAVNEQCFQYQECSLLQPFVDAAKPVFSIEYASDESTAEDIAKQDSVCTQSAGQGLDRLILPLQLDDSFRVECP